MIFSRTTTQTLNPGHPCILSTASAGFDMWSGTYVASSPEAVPLHCATAQMAHFYGLPFQSASGLDSCLPDAQAGYERMLQAAPMALTGVNFIHLAFGMMDQLLTSNYEQAVIDNEIFTTAFRLAEGVEVTDSRNHCPETAQVIPQSRPKNCHDSQVCTCSYVCLSKFRIFINASAGLTCCQTI